MARISNYLGKISGKVGDVVYKSVHGKSYVCSVPSKYTAAMDPESIKRRSVFRFVNNFCSALNSILIIREIWKKKAHNMSAFNFMIKLNYKNISESGVEHSLLSPQIYHFKFDVKEKSIEGLKIKITVLPLTNRSYIFSNIEGRINALGVMILEEPDSLLTNKYAFIPLQSAEIETRLNTELEFVFQLNDVQAESIEKYPVRKFVFNLITVEKTGNPVKISDENCISF